MATQTYREAPISLNNAAKKYGVPQTTLSVWAKKGKIKVLQRPERRGQALLVDEASIVLALQEYKPLMTPGRQFQPVMPLNHNQPEPSNQDFKTKDLIDQFLTAKRMAPKTVRWYQDLLYPFDDKYPDYPLDPAPFREFLTGLPEKMSPRRQLNYWRALKTLCLWCNLEYELPEYFSRAARKKVEAPTSAASRRKLPRTLTDDELRAVFKAADNFLDKTLLKTLGFTGIRAGELCSLTSERISPEHITVYGKTGENRIPITPDSYNDLMILAAEVPPGKPIFRAKDGKPMNSDGVFQRVSKCMKRAGITGAKLGAHTLRHTFGRIMQRESGDLVTLQHLLGHTQISTTRIYAELSDKEVDDKLEKYGPHRLFSEEGVDHESV